MVPKLFQWGAPRELASGRVSPWKIECDALSMEEWMALGKLAQQIVPTYFEAEEVPRGGKWFAIAMTMGQSLDPRDPILLVDDVWTTGKTMTKQRGTRNALGLVLFARGPTPDWVTVLFTAHPKLWSL